MLFVLFMLVPIFDLIRVSFYSWDGLMGDMKWIGLKNYKTMFSNSLFWSGFWNTVYFIIGGTVLIASLSIFLAAVLSKGNIRFKNFYRILFYFPNILSVVVISGIFTGVFAPDRGVLSSFLTFVGLESLVHNWLADPSTVRGCILFVMVWQAVGYYMVMYLTGMDGIDNSLYEFSDLEGATGIQKFFKITLPMTWEVIRVTISLFVISSINMSFLFVNAMTGGGPNGSSDVLLNIMYQQSYDAGNYGYGMAVGSFLFVFSFGLSLILKRLTNKKE